MLGTIGGDEVVSIMLQALENPDAGVRCNAALALGNLRLKKAVAPLIGLMQDEDGEFTCGGRFFSGSDWEIAGGDCTNCSFK